ncbi:PQQ-dependent sugar dehydrogenase [Phycicoccus flavus]|uniref:Glucose/Sorbosone dehydrogenase domain-containing protein n=1 Tax=Phycicoccus flavus TaxID=2502783 RepID=A0A8T6R3N4_9MICO|nr:PQQ-dependent sugar dehydrogenase [Phycicoccus flavus]NHA68100.1 hypothetical protein [Phycicoccus flavus]
MTSRRSVRIRRPAALAALPVLVLALAAATATPAPALPVATPVARADVAPTTTTRTVLDQSVPIPWDVGFLPDGRMVTTLREGRLVFSSDGVPGPEEERVVTIPDVRASGESGALGVAVDTDYERHPYVYVCASRDPDGPTGGAPWVNEVLRYQVLLGPTLSVGSPTVILTGMAAATTHNGCALEMDGDGLLWVGMGDAAVASRAQDRGSLNGKVLRITRTGRVPVGNPVIDGRRDAVWSMGHRNPQGIAFQPGTGRVYEVEHGPSVDDEVNLLRPGGNYGWPCYTGAGRPNSTSGCGPAGDYLPPVWASGDRTVATSGASFARGSQWQDWQGDLFVSVLKDSEVLRFDVAADGSLGAPQILLKNAYGRLRGSVAGPGGRLYLTTSNGSDTILQVSPATTSSSRVDGANRYVVAANVSRITYPGGADEVIVATGSRFPDALAGSAAAAKRGAPVLLTGRSGLPVVTREEIARLAPDRIVVVGGAEAVDDDVLVELRRLAPTVERVDGADRYAVAAGVAARPGWFPAGASPVFLTSGEDFPDALSATPAAARSGAPVLLTRAGRLPAATERALRDLRPTRVYVLGGEQAVRSEVLARVGEILPGTGVERVGGENRYQVARKVAERFWSSSRGAWVASGRTFPDGLTGGAAAGRGGFPVLLTRSVAVAPDAGQALLELAPTRVTVVGGTSAVSGYVGLRFGALVGDA